MKIKALLNIAALAAVIVLLAACGGPGSQPTIAPTHTAAPTAAAPAGETPLPATSAPTETLPAATADYPPPDEPTAPPSSDYPPPDEPTAPPSDDYPAPGGDSAAVIGPDNAASLSAHIMGLPEYPERLLWPAPGLLEAAPDASLLLQAGPYLHPVVLLGEGPDPAGLGQPVPLPLNSTELLAVSPDASALLIQDPSQLGLFSPNGQRLHVIEHPGPYGANFSPDSRYLAVLSGEQLAVDVFEAASGEHITQLTGFETAAPVYNTFIAPGGATAVWIARATVQMQDVASGTMGTRLDFVDFVSSFAFSPDGARIAISAGDKLGVYSLPAGELLVEITTSQPVTSLAFSPDGRLVAGAYGPTVQIWETQALTPAANLPGPTASTSMVSFSPDGRFLVSVHDENQLAVWRTR